MVYLDCNASTPIEPEIAESVSAWLKEEFGNASSRTHEFGVRAKRMISAARAEISAVVDAEPENVIFTSGATESNNIAILGLAHWAESSGKKHIVTSSIEHDAVLAPIRWLRDHAGFDVTAVDCGISGVIDPEDIKRAMRPNTGLVSLMHVNNETGVIQDLSGLSQALMEHPAYLHVDAAQGFGKEFAGPRHRRIDMLSVSGHKIYGPQGVGALIVRKDSRRTVPLKPLFYGGGQEGGMRPGTQPVHLIVGLGMAAKFCLERGQQRNESNLLFRNRLISGLKDLPVRFNGDQDRVMPHVANLSVEGIDSEAAMVALKGCIAISNGSACTSSKYEPSHVLTAMGLTRDQIDSSLRFSWCHLTPEVDWDQVESSLQGFLS